MFLYINLLYSTIYNKDFNLNKVAGIKKAWGPIMKDYLQLNGYIIDYEKQDA